MRDYMTEDFYAVLEEAFATPAFSPADYEMLFLFTTERWRPEPDYEILDVQKTDKTHARVIINVKEKIWNNDEEKDFFIDDDGSRHQIVMEKIDGQWLLADVDGKKQEFEAYNAACRKEQSWIRCMEEYLTDSIAPYYAPADISIPSVILVCYNCDDSMNLRFWCDYWVFNYDVHGDTLVTVSGGNHPGCMTLAQNGDSIRVLHFEQAEEGAGHTASLKRMFGDEYVYYERLKEDDSVLEKHRKESIRNYAGRHHLTITRYKDYGMDAVATE